MNFECPEGCKAYYSVNGTELDLNAAQGTVDLKSGQKQVTFIFFLLPKCSYCPIFVRVFWHIAVCIHQWLMCNLWMPTKWRCVWLLWGRGTNLKEWRWLQNGFPYLCLSKERSIERRHQDQFPKSKGQTMLPQILYHCVGHIWRCQNIGVSWTPIPTQPGAKDVWTKLWGGNLATTHYQWHSFQTQWNRFGNGFWTILYWTSTKNFFFGFWV